MELGKKIKQLRLRSGLTQEQLAAKVGIGAQSVSKWETAVAMPDISTLPLLAETFGVTIDELFDLSTEQRMNRIENRMDVEEELPPDVFREYEDFLKALLTEEQYKKRAQELIAYLYWHRMNSYAQKVRRYAKDAIRNAPNEKSCQWMLNMAEGHAVWDWNVSNHKQAIDFYSELVQKNPDQRLPYLYLLDNLLADHRADEAEQVLGRLCRLPDLKPVFEPSYRAHIALARFDAAAADAIIEQMLREAPEDSDCLFEGAQYYALKCDYDKAVDCYERAFACDPRRPRYQDALMGIADISEIRGDYARAADACRRIVALLKNEWGMTEDLALQQAEDRLRRMEELSRGKK